MDRKRGSCVGSSGEEISPGKYYGTKLVLTLVIVHILALTILYFAV